MAGNSSGGGGGRQWRRCCDALTHCRSSAYRINHRSRCVEPYLKGGGAA